MLSLLWLMLHVFGSRTLAPHNTLVASLPFGHPFLSNSASYVQKRLGQTDWDLSRSHFVTMDSEKISWNFVQLHYLQNTTVSFLFIDPSDITFVITIIIWVLLDNLFFLHYNPSISKAISFSINLGNVSSTTPFARSWRIFSTLLTCSGSSSASSIKCICPTHSSTNHLSKSVFSQYTHYAHNTTRSVLSKQSITLYTYLSILLPHKYPLSLAVPSPYSLSSPSPSLVHSHSISTIIPKFCKILYFWYRYHSTYFFEYVQVHIK